ncbi:MAG: acetylornithine transaminase [Corynebacterium sp.]|uniref:acetylornithine transaminase n=1 Tax=Corynebacterium sp. TaxID=1720 RepID=UPI0026DD2F3C|nr:acetylornithine transaminase [Corynebacterium sp.]MDO5098542.1 acetylornithine transaminase [Corynebacterium sp.]
MSNSDNLAHWQEVIMNTYGAPKIEVVSALGSVIDDSEGRKHIDLLGGIAVNALGHAHPTIIKAVTDQISTFGHVSNLMASAPAIDLATELIKRFSLSCAADANQAIEIAGESRVFFCNSGAEANEAALKIARLTGRSRILAAENGFHGRTMGALSLTGQSEKRQPFYPLLMGVQFYPYGDIDYLRKMVEIDANDVAAIFIEPIQGETGVIPAPEGFLREVRALCDEFGILMVVDEVQTGVGRTGKFFAFQHEGIRPDIVTMAKGLGGGLPIGACLASGPAATLLSPGEHGTTFGGNPVCCAAGNAVIKVIDDNFCNTVANRGAILAELAANLPGVVEVRGKGLMLGVIFEQPIAKELAARCTDYGVIINAPTEYVLRLTPPLIISEFEMQEAAKRLTALITDVLEAYMAEVAAAEEAEKATEEGTFDGEFVPQEVEV